MKYNFDEKIDRKGSGCVKWDAIDDSELIPMWVADMDFKAAPCIIEAMQRRLDHGVFGYEKIPDTYYDAVINWFSQRHNWNIQKEWILHTIGVVPALGVIINALTNENDKILIQPPVYNCFFSMVTMNGRKHAFNNLVYHDNTYSIDFEDFERKAADPDVKLFILCNPHNPACRVWTKEELKRMGEICIRNGVTIIADEIHCEIVRPAFLYTPFASISNEFQQHCIVCNAASKAFNIAGLQTSNIVVADTAMKEKIEKQLESLEMGMGNPFGIEALTAAYNEGADWIDEMNLYIEQNYLTLSNFIKEKHPRLPILNCEGTYLAWMNIEATGMTSKEFEEQLLKEEHLWVNSGTMYGEEAGEGFVRINLACPRGQLEKALVCLDRFLCRKGF